MGDRKEEDDVLEEFLHSILSTSHQKMLLSKRIENALDGFRHNPDKLRLLVQKLRGFNHVQILQRIAKKNQSLNRQKQKFRTFLNKNYVGLRETQDGFKIVVETPPHFVVPLGNSIFYEELAKNREWQKKFQDIFYQQVMEKLDEENKIKSFDVEIYNDGDASGVRIINIRFICAFADISMWNTFLKWNEEFIQDPLDKHRILLEMVDNTVVLFRQSPLPYVHVFDVTPDKDFVDMHLNTIIRFWEKIITQNNQSLENMVRIGFAFMGGGGGGGGGELQLRRLKSIRLEVMDVRPFMNIFNMTMTQLMVKLNMFNIFGLSLNFSFSLQEGYNVSWFVLGCIEKLPLSFCKRIQLWMMGTIPILSRSQKQILHKLSEEDDYSCVKVSYKEDIINFSLSYTPAINEKIKTFLENKQNFTEFFQRFSIDFYLTVLADPLLLTGFMNRGWKTEIDVSVLNLLFKSGYNKKKLENDIQKGIISRLAQEKEGGTLQLGSFDLVQQLSPTSFHISLLLTNPSQSSLKISKISKVDVIIDDLKGSQALIFRTPHYISVMVKDILTFVLNPPKSTSVVSPPPVLLSAQQQQRRVAQLVLQLQSMGVTGGGGGKKKKKKKTPTSVPSPVLSLKQVHQQQEPLKQVVPKESQQPLKQERMLQMLPRAPALPPLSPPLKKESQVQVIFLNKPELQHIQKGYSQQQQQQGRVRKTVIPVVVQTLQGLCDGMVSQGFFADTVSKLQVIVVGSEVLGFSLYDSDVDIQIRPIQGQDRKVLLDDQQIASLLITLKDGMASGKLLDNVTELEIIDKGTIAPELLKFKFDGVDFDVSVTNDITQTSVVYSKITSVQHGMDVFAQHHESKVTLKNMMLALKRFYNQPWIKNKLGKNKKLPSIVLTIMVIAYFRNITETSPSSFPKTVVEALNGFMKFYREEFHPNKNYINSQMKVASWSNSQHKHQQRHGLVVEDPAKRRLSVLSIRGGGGGGGSLPSSSSILNYTHSIYAWSHLVFSLFNYYFEVIEDVRPFIRQYMEQEEKVLQRRLRQHKPEFMEKLSTFVSLPFFEFLNKQTNHNETLLKRYVDVLVFLYMESVRLHPEIASRIVQTLQSLYPHSPVIIMVPNILPSKTDRQLFHDMSSSTTLNQKVFSSIIMLGSSHVNKDSVFNTGNFYIVFPNVESALEFMTLKLFPISHLFPPFLNQNDVELLQKKREMDHMFQRKTAQQFSKWKQQKQESWFGRSKNQQI